MRSLSWLIRVLHKYKHNYPGFQFIGGDFLQFSLSKLCEQTTHVPKIDMWRMILTWAMYKQEELEWENDDSKVILEQVQQETQALEVILDWVRHAGMDALEKAEYMLNFSHLGLTRNSLTLLFPLWSLRQELLLLGLDWITSKFRRLWMLFLVKVNLLLQTVMYGEA